jgi:ATP-dependent DNA ligase
MASDKRDFSDFDAFPGSISKAKVSKGWYLFPRVRSIDSMGRTRVWNIYVRLISTKDGNAPPRRKINWDDTVDTVVPLSSRYLDGDDKHILKNTIAQMWTEQGIDHLTKSIPTYVISGKNIGKKNSTNVFTQALINARSKYLKKMQESSDRNNQKRFFPFAVHKYDTNPKDITKHLRLPIGVQRKLDGGRACAYYDMDLNKPVMYTRKLKDLYGNIHIIEDLKSLFAAINKKYPGIYLDGELYKHGLSLQIISGMMRREEKAKDNILLQYHIFDVFFPAGEEKMQKLSYTERNIILDDIFKIADFPFLVRVKTHIVNTFEEETNLYEQFLEEKYEGSIVRNLDSSYEFGVNKEIRTYQVRKRKPRYSAEYEIIGYTEGLQGKDKGAIIWILTTGKEMTTLDGKKKKIEPIQFTSTPVGMNYEERYKLFNMTPENFITTYKGKQMTVEYDDISEDGVPLRAKAKGVRILD